MGGGGGTAQSYKAIVTYFVKQMYFLNGHNLVHGGWSEWTNITGTCSVTCGFGYQWINQSRSCTSPKPANGGESCGGPAVLSAYVVCTVDVSCDQSRSPGGLRRHPAHTLCFVAFCFCFVSFCFPPSGI